MSFSRPLHVGLLLLRLVFGLGMLAGHGIAKAVKLFSGGPIEFADPFGLGPTVSLALAVFAEVVCALLVALGLYTRWATVPLIVTMLVAFFFVHLADPFSAQEKSLLYLGAYVTLLLTGPGRYSLDERIRPVL